MECYKLIVKDSEGNELLNKTFPLDSFIGIVEETYPMEFDGWCRKNLLFCNAKMQTVNAYLEEDLHLEELDGSLKGTLDFHEQNKFIHILWVSVGISAIAAIISIFALITKLLQ